MFLPFKNVTTRQRFVSCVRDRFLHRNELFSAAYAVLCVALGLGIKYMDDHMPAQNPSTVQSGDHVLLSAKLSLLIDLDVLTIDLEQLGQTSRCSTR
ncbi:hypothetical protein PsorP6_017451 [Peronosclerospora sorghi]|uniref:Uncharacterized protein n=1 Tax=Peronosclerospora sorghi TaxID=230839 RepID=A0ACC0WLY1_9STRA|nr:hypothetical protein PsorP6_017451 [Peronosclerospora sorghi]